MSLANIVVSLYPNVPDLPGVPQLNRSPDFPTDDAPTLGTPAAQDSLWQSSNQAPAWGIVDSDLNLVLSPDSVLDFDNRNEWRISNFPVQAGGFASYNKVTVPFEVSVRMSKGGGVGDRAQFLSDLNNIAQSLALYTILTPERSYSNCNITRYEVSRRGVAGAYFLTEVDVFFVQIIQVTAQYTTTAASTQNAQNPASVPPVNQGIVQPKAPWPAIPNQFGSPPFVLGTDPNTVFSTLGGGPTSIANTTPVSIGP
jgi:hypothetical protein